MIQLNSGRGYAGYPAGSIIQLLTSEEAALVLQGAATYSPGPVTPGNLSTTKSFGRAGIATGAQTVTISNPMFTAESKFTAALSNATPDTGATFITRITPAVGSVTFGVNANAAAAIAIDWVLMTLSGELPPS